MISTDYLNYEERVSRESSIIQYRQSLGRAVGVPLSQSDISEEFLAPCFGRRSFDIEPRTMEFDQLCRIGNCRYESPSYPVEHRRHFRRGGQAMDTVSSYRNFLASSWLTAFTVYPGAILRNLVEVGDIRDLRARLAKLEHWTQLLRVRRLIEKELIHNKLNLRPVVRRGLLELLHKTDEQSATEIAYDWLVPAAKDSVMDDYTVGCLAILRLSTPANEKHGDLRDTLSALLLNALPVSSPTLIERRVLSEVILGIGYYGTSSDTDLILNVIESDYEYYYGDQAAATLRRLLSTYPEVTPEPAIQRLRTLCGDLLDGWIKPRVLANVDAFVQASQTISILCARLEPCDLSVAYEAVKKAGDQELGIRMLRYIARSRQRLESRGHADWLKKHSNQIDEIQDRLQVLLA